MFRCASCIASKWPCRWCPSAHLCLDPDSLKCPSSSTVASKQQVLKPKNDRSENPIVFQGEVGQFANRCTQIDKATAPEILVSDSTNASILLTVMNMAESKRKNLSCVFSSNTTETAKTRAAGIQVPAILEGNRVRCSPAFFHFESSESHQNLILELTDQQKPIDKTFGS